MSSTYSITCPGVWLCSNGFLEATIKTLGYFFKTGAMEPKFPALCHDQFVMEGYFKSIQCMSELEQVLGGESIEITLWQNGRRLAYFTGQLADVMHPPVPRFSCFHNVNVQILMHPSQAFPGIIAPKLEISARAVVEERQCTRDLCSSLGTSIHSVVLPNLGKSASEKTSHNHSEPTDHRRQRPVCHSKASGFQDIKPPSGNSHLTGLSHSFDPCLSSKESIFSNNSRAQSRRISLCSSSNSSNSFSLPSVSDATRCSHVPSSPSDTADHQKYCKICLTYSNTFNPLTTTL